MATAATATINDKLPRLKKQLSDLYDNFFVDNKQVVSYLRNIQGAGGNFFDRTSKKVLSLKMPSETYASGNKDYVFLDSNMLPNDDLTKYKKLLTTILVVVTALKHYVTSNEFSKESFITITTITITTSTNQEKNPTVPSNNREFYNTNAITYTVSGQSITVNCNFPSDIMTIAGNNTMRSAIQDLQSDDANNILLNYLRFMFQPKPNNIRRHIVAFYYYIRVLHESFQFFYRAERLIGVNSADTKKLCAIFNSNYVKDSTSYNRQNIAKDVDYAYYYLSELRKLNTVLSQPNTTDDWSYINIGTITTVCPLKVTFTGDSAPQKLNSSSDNINTRLHNDNKKGLIAPETHEAYIQYIRTAPTSIALAANPSAPDTTTTIEKTYQIKNVEYESNGSTGLDKKDNNLKSVTLYAREDTGNPGVTCADDEYVSIDDVTSAANLNKQIQIKFRPKSDQDLARTFYKAGTELTDMNESIVESKDKINGQVKTFQLQNDTLKSIDTRMTVYYVIFAIMALVILVILLLDIPQTMKIYVSVVIAGVLLIMSMINYFWNYKVIETFGDNDVLQDCTNINASSTLIQRVRFVNSKIPLFTREMVTILDNLGNYVYALDSIDMKEKLSNSLQDERRTYQEHSEIYKYKQEMNTKSMDIMKHDMIKKTAYMNMLTINFFVLALVLIFYMIDPSHINTYLTLAAILIIVNLLVYYFVILHPVRTMAKNKYWIKPSDSVLQSLS